jgi:hypothetical protein
MTLDFPFPAPVVLAHCHDCDLTFNAFDPCDRLAAKPSPTPTLPARGSVARSHEGHDVTFTQPRGDQHVDHR